MKMIITGDTHGAPEKRFRNILRDMEYKLGQAPSFTKEDLMVVTGDFGAVWGCGTPKEKRNEDRILDELEAMPFTTVFIDGNHENFDRLYSFPETEMFGGMAGVLRPSVFHLKQRGHVYDFGGVKTWCFGGGASIDKPLRKNGVSWWPAEEPTEDEYAYGLKQLKEHSWKVDLVLTHEAPSGAVLSLGLRPLLRSELGYEPNLYDPLSPYLELVSRKLKFGRWLFGHYHKDETAFTSMTCGCAEYPAERNYTALYSTAVEFDFDAQAD